MHKRALLAADLRISPSDDDAVDVGAPTESQQSFIAEKAQAAVSVEVTDALIDTLARDQAGLSQPANEQAEGEEVPSELTWPMLREKIRETGVSAKRFDVNGDGAVTPTDVLKIINYLNNDGSGPDGSITVGPPYYDVNLDGNISPQDVLAVINYLNQYGAGNVTSPKPTVTIDSHGQPTKLQASDFFDNIGEQPTYFIPFSPKHGTVTLDTVTGAMTYTPDSAQPGSDTYPDYFIIAVIYGNPSQWVSTRVNLNVVANTAPIAVDDTFVAYAGSAISGNVLTNDTDSEGDPLTARLVTSPQNFTLMINPDGSFRADPNPGFVGVDTFTYYANDGLKDSDAPAIVNLYSSENNPPIFVSQSAPLPVEQFGSVIVNLSQHFADDFDWNKLQFVSSSTEATTQIDPVTTVMTVTPNAASTGIITVNVEARDSQNAVGYGTFVFDVIANQPPVIVVPDDISIPQHRSVVVELGSLTADREGDAITLDASSRDAALVIDQVGKTITVTPNPDVTGSFDVEVSATDSHGAVNTATFRFLVIPNRAPVLISQTINVIAGRRTDLDAPGVLAGAYDLENDPFSISVQTSAYVTALLNADGSMSVFTNSELHDITEAVTTNIFVNATDQHGNVSSTPYPVVIHPNRPEAVGDFSGTVTAGHSISFNVLEAVIERGGKAPFAIKTGPVPDATILIDQHTGEVTIIPNQGFAGSQNFAVIIEDSLSHRFISNIHLDVRPNVAPEIEPRTFSMPMNTLFTLTPAQAGVIDSNPEHRQFRFEILSVRNMEAWVDDDGNLQGVSYTDGRTGTVEVLVRDLAGTRSNAVTLTFTFGAPAGEGEGAAMRQFTKDVDTIFREEGLSEEGI